MKQKILTILSICILFIVMIVNFGMNTFADEKDAIVLQPYYKCIEIQDGDSLWTIAAQYKEGSGLTIDKYIEKLKSMNNLSEEIIHKGQNISVVYYK